MVDTLSVTPVDDLLRQARQLLGTMNPVQWETAFPAPPPAPGGWDSSAADAAAETTVRLDSQTDRLRAAHREVAAAIAEANEISRSAHTQLNAVENAWASDRAALHPASAVEENQAGLLQAAQQHVREVTAVVQAAAEQFQIAAHRIATATASLSS